MFEDFNVNEKNIVFRTKSKIFYKEQNYLIKLFSKKYTMEQILYEALNHAEINAAGLNIPKLYEVKKFGDYIGIVMDYIGGESLEKKVERDKDNLNKYIDIFVGVHHDILSSRATRLQNLHDRVINKILKSKLPMTYKYSLIYKYNEIKFDRDIVHGDFVLSNVIIDENNVPHTVDWAHVAFGNKIFDISITYALFLVSGKEDIAKIYLENICKVENISECDVLNLLVIAYTYIVDRYEDEETQNKVYDTIYKLIKEREV